MMQFMQKIFLIILMLTCLTSLKLQANKAGLPAPAYLSNPYFLTCKAKCPAIDHGTWQELNMDCIHVCMWFYEGKQAAEEAFEHAWTWLGEHI